VCLGRRLRWGRPEEAALRRRQWRGGQRGDGDEGVVGREMRRPFIERGLGDDSVVMAAIPPYYGALAGARTAGAVDGPAVRRAHGDHGASVGGRASGGGA
jgi:hypothetical protein